MKTCLNILILVTCLICHRVWALECHIDSTATNEVKFISDAPFEDFEGITDRIDGYVVWPDDSLHENLDVSGSEYYFEVDLNSLDTGIGLRNRHMRDNYLETDLFPFTYYSGKLTSVKRRADGSFEIGCSGEIFIHGVKQPLSLVCQVEKVDDHFLVQTGFEVKLTDFKIEIPSLMFMKINEIIKLELGFFIRPIKL